MKLDYFTLLSPQPVKIQNVGSIISPTLNDISNITYSTYKMFLQVLLTDIKGYYNAIDMLGDNYFLPYSETQKRQILKIKQEYEAGTQHEKNNISFFNIFIFDYIFRDTILHALNFFIKENVVYSNELKLFTVYDTNIENPIGTIHGNNYNEVIDVIFQRLAIQSRENNFQNVKVKNKTAQSLLDKIKKGSQKNSEKVNKKMELPNLISSLASHHNSLNMINIWNLTVYQLNDQFQIQCIDDAYEIQSMSVAAWGDSQGKFDNTIWYSLIN